MNPSQKYSLTFMSSGKKKPAAQCTLVTGKGSSEDELRVCFRRDGREGVREVSLVMCTPDRDEKSTSKPTSLLP